MHLCNILHILQLKSISIIRIYVYVFAHARAHTHIYNFRMLTVFLHATNLTVGGSQSMNWKAY